MHCKIYISSTRFAVLQNPEIQFTLETGNLNYEKRNCDENLGIFFHSEEFSREDINFFYHNNEYSHSLPFPLSIDICTQQRRPNR